MKEDKEKPNKEIKSFSERQQEEQDAYWLSPHRESVVSSNPYLYPRSLYKVIEQCRNRQKR
ncbi:MAG: hypothetical protein ACKPJO_14315 [Dolichospermum sp.]